jgi:NAD(P)-dependent dehydrogenase (short-subunit alcohol dehydrogenase family)
MSNSAPARVAIVTGASSGLGVAFATALAEAGAHVALGARRADRLADSQKLVEDTGRRAIAVRTDVTRPEDCQALADAAMCGVTAGRRGPGRDGSAGTRRGPWPGRRAGSWRTRRVPAGRG